jgi:hypothetical protein
MIKILNEIFLRGRNRHGDCPARGRDLDQLVIQLEKLRTSKWYTLKRISIWRFRSGTS